jgi:5-methyltetrahydropteroyltriglutamate--homocysteine methyltransferase
MTENSTRATVYGYPRQGNDRQLKKAIESYWAGRIDARALLEAARDLRLERLLQLRDAGIDEIPSNDFSLYDHVLDTAWMLGAIPPRHVAAVPVVDTPAARLDRYFAMARGAAQVAPLEMTKWFNTNYHYLVPELGPDSEFALDATKPLLEFTEAKDAGLITRPVVLGPISFLLLAKSQSSDFDPLALLDKILPLYVDLLGQLRAAGAEWVQLDEPCLVTDQPPPPAVLARLARTYEELTAAAARPKILVASYFDRLGESLSVLAASAVEGLALDFVGPAAANVAGLAAIGGVPGKRLVAGVVNGHNIWLADLPAALATLGTLLGLAGSVDVSASCSLLHVPLDVDLERDLDPQLASWFSFAPQKLDEIVTLAKGCVTAATRLLVSCGSTPRVAPPERLHRSSRSRLSEIGSSRSMPTTCAAKIPTAKGILPNRKGCSYRCCRRPPSAHSRRRPHCAGPARTWPRAPWTRPPTSDRCARRSGK